MGLLVSGEEGSGRQTRTPSKQSWNRRKNTSTSAEDIGLTKYPVAFSTQARSDWRARMKALSWGVSSGARYIRRSERNEDAMFEMWG
jgi:hypothetical protein